MSDSNNNSNYGSKNINTGVNGRNVKNRRRKKSSSRSFVLLLFTAVVIFALGFMASYLISTRGNNVGEGDQNQPTTTQDVTNGTDENEDTTGIDGADDNQDQETKDNENTADNTGKDNESPDEDGTKDGTGDEDDEKPQGNEDIPVNPTEPNVEKLDVAALEPLSNTKYSWWIKLNNEHKTPEIPSDIRSMIDKHDGIYVGDTSKKVIYLTFDEGYENGYTPQILDVLKANDVKTIFFVTGSYIDRNPELVQRMLDEGHQVGNHTITHPSLPDLDYEKLENELLGLDKKFYEKFGTSFKYMRPPAGEYSERTLAAAKQLGYKTIFWSFAYDDWYADKIRGADYAYNKVMANLHNGAVYLLHAVSKDNADALDRIIKDIKAQGYEIRPFDL